MSLGMMIPPNWDGLSMAASQLQSYKQERPVYSTPHPVQSTPANNECKLVELRGAEVASFVIGDEEYICLPQAFDLFLKHLVGGLHTVYTKLKRLNITPVVCNVEQVRVLRGLGAIQPGVNRCKLITRKDFEILYQDCTTASRPGRPPKRFPILPQSELMPHHPNARTMNTPRGIHSSPDLSSFYKRMRMDPEANFHHQQARRISTSPTRRSPPSGRSAGADELYANAANIYLQQALRHQYQQFIANGLHNGMNPQHSPANAALAPLIGMSNPGLFNGTIPHNLLNQINEYASRGRGNPNSLMNSEEHRSAATSPRQDKSENSEKSYRSPGGRNSSLTYEASADTPLIHGMKTPTPENRQFKSSPHHGFDAKMHESHNSPLTPNSANGRNSVGDISVSSYDSGKKSPADAAYRGFHSPRDDSDVFDAESMNQTKYDVIKAGKEKDEITGSPMADNNEHDWQATSGSSSISSMQTLLSNIQGLLKVAADNAKLQDKQLSFEIAELKNRISKEQELRGVVERKLEESERTRASIQRKLNRERDAVKRLQQQKLATHEKLHQSEQNGKPSEEVDVTSSPFESRSEPCSPSSRVDAHPALHLQTDSTVSVPTSTETSEFSPTASSPSAVSPSSVNDCPSYWPARPLAIDNTSHRNNSASHSPERSSPINMATADRNWMTHNLLQQSSSCAK